MEGNPSLRFTSMFHHKFRLIIRDATATNWKWQVQKKNDSVPATLETDIFKYSDLFNRELPKQMLRFEYDHPKIGESCFANSRPRISQTLQGG